MEIYGKMMPVVTTTHIPSWHSGEVARGMLTPINQSDADAFQFESSLEWNIIPDAILIGYGINDWEGAIVGEPWEVIDSILNKDRGSWDTSGPYDEKHDTKWISGASLDVSPLDLKQSTYCYKMIYFHYSIAGGPGLAHGGHIISRQLSRAICVVPSPVLTSGVTRLP